MQRVHCTRPMPTGVFVCPLDMRGVLIGNALIKDSTPCTTRVLAPAGVGMLLTG